MSNLAHYPPPIGQLAALDLIAAVLDGDDRLERHYLEAKGPLDLRSKRDAAKVAKFILGAANRAEEVAKTALGGYAALIIGVTDGKAPGVEPIEPMDVARAVERYVGARGESPAWDVVRVPAHEEGNEVLVVVVPPPRPGQPIYLCLADGDELSDGAVYVRADGETRRATSGEMRVLLNRSAAPTNLAANFGVEVVGRASSLVADVERASRTYIDAVRRDLLSALTEKQTPSLDRAMVASVLLPGRLPENRSEAAYRQEIDRWAIEVRNATEAGLKKLHGNLLDKISVVLKNNVDTYFQDVELKIHLSGAVMGVHHHPATKWRELDLSVPSPPRRWGPYPDPRFAALLESPVLNLVPTAQSIMNSLPASSGWSNGGSIDLWTDVGEVRPRRRVELEEPAVVLVVDASHSDAVSGTWEITARDHHKVYSGDLSVDVAPPRDVTAFLEAYFASLMPRTP